MKTIRFTDLETYLEGQKEWAQEFEKGMELSTQVDTEYILPYLWVFGVMIYSFLARVIFSVFIFQEIDEQLQESFEWKQTSTDVIRISWKQ